ncbi:MAG: Hcp family type VI secretion system effector [Thermoanaerobaculia bacterium]
MKGKTMAAVDMFLKLDGVAGESQATDHKGEIQLAGFRLGLTSPRDSFTNQATGVRRWSHLSMRSSVEMSTPLLFQKLASNAKIPKAVLTCRKAGGAQFPYFTVTLSDVLVVKVETGELEAQGGDVIPHCDFDLAFSHVEISASPQTAGGPTSGCNMFADDLASNKSS